MLYGALGSFEGAFLRTGNLELLGGSFFGLPGFANFFVSSARGCYIIFLFGFKK